MVRINKNIFIEDLIQVYPQSVRFLMEKGITCIACGAPVWGTLEDNAQQKGMDDETIEQLVEELNKQLK